jgi:integrase
MPAHAMVASAQEAQLEAEQTKDIWAMSCFGHSGRLDFTAISQPWLREGMKRWALHDLIRRRGKDVTTALRAHVAAIAGLSESLRIHRTDQGLVIRELGRHDIEMFLQRIAYLEHCDRISELSRALNCRKAHHALRQMRLLGLTRSGGPLSGLPDDFALRREDIPRRPDLQPASRALPPEILAQLCDALPLLRTRAPKVLATAIELLIDTGRRPNEILNLSWDCLGRDHDDKYVLVYDDLKNNRPGRRLPITKVTAELISAQQRDTQNRFPDIKPSALLLLPSDHPEPKGKHPMGRHNIGRTHRRWLAALPSPLLRSDGSIFDLTTITPYSYRHTYAQRHADAGVPLDVLAELMGHELLSSTQAYYQIGEKRRRAAVDRLANHQFDRHGNHLWRDAQALLDDEHARHILGHVSVPYGTCQEPTNVQAGGGACPFRFRCVGCDHFHTDPSHLPELKAYLHDLLRDRERVLATTDLEDWARTEALPSEEEIRRMKELVHKVEEHLDQLNSAEQADIAAAVSAVRRTRQITNLGMPSIKRQADHRAGLEKP